MNKYNYLYAFLIYSSIPAQAEIIDTAIFSASPMAIVWGSVHISDNSYAKPIISDYINLTEPYKNSDNHLVSGNSIPFLTGFLTKPYQDTDEDSLSKENNSTVPILGTGVLANSPSDLISSNNHSTKLKVSEFNNLTVNQIFKKSFYVTSNYPFDIYAQTGYDDAEVNSQNNVKINLTMSITQSGAEGGISHGSKSQSPTEGGSGFVAFPLSLLSLKSPTKIYSAGRKTAASPGSITEQSVRFNIEYEIIKKSKLNISYSTIRVAYIIYIP